MHFVKLNRPNRGPIIVNLELVSEIEVLEGRTPPQTKLTFAGAVNSGDRSVVVLEAPDEIFNMQSIGTSAR